jgi:PAS domain S-box-containing protein
MSSELRAAAESRIQSHTTPPATASALSPEVLELLHRLATAEDSANDALRMLHELKVHQVELDLQLEQAHQNEQELAQELAVYRALWQFVPAGYFSVSLDGHVIQGNRAGAMLFGVDASELPGRRIDEVVAAEFRPNVQSMLDQLRDCNSAVVCETRSSDHNGSSLPLRLVANRVPGSESCLVLIMEYEHTESIAASS